MRFYALLLLSLISCHIVAQDTPYNHINMVYDQDIKTVTLEANGNPAVLPVIHTNSGYIQLKFDDLSGAERSLFYKFIHCDRFWNASDLRDLDYISGFNEEPIRGLTYSVNTRVTYIHYDQQFPNKNTSFKLSGNYILLIYEDTPDKPIITRRFVVAETKANIEVTQVFASDVENISHKQEFTVDITGIGVKVRAPQEEFSVSMIRNEDWFTEIQAKPSFVTNDRMRFNKLGTFLFWGLLEFRQFDTRSLNIVGRGIDFVTRTKEGFDIKLTPVSMLAENVFTTNNDFNGRFYIDNFDALGRLPPTKDINSGRPASSISGDRDINADYVNLNFELVKTPLLEDDEDIYVLGAFNNWIPNESCRMKWSDKSESYHNRIQLKQGFYNYCFAVVNSKGDIDFAKIDGSWAQTENDYHVLLYYKGIQDIYDRVLAVTTVNSQTRLNKN